MGLEYGSLVVRFKGTDNWGTPGLRTVGANALVYTDRSSPVESD